MTNKTIKNIGKIFKTIGKGILENRHSKQREIVNEEHKTKIFMSSIENKRQNGIKIQL